MPDDRLVSSRTVFPKEPVWTDMGSGEATVTVITSSPGIGPGDGEECLYVHLEN